MKYFEVKYRDTTIFGFRMVSDATIRGLLTGLNVRGETPKC